MASEGANALEFLGVEGAEELILLLSAYVSGALEVAGSVDFVGDAGIFSCLERFFFRLPEKNMEQSASICRQQYLKCLKCQMHDLMNEKGFVVALRIFTAY